MRDQPRWQAAALIPLVVGLAWLIFGWSHGLVVAVLATLAGVPLLGCATAIAFWPGDRQITQYLAVGAVASIFLAVVLWPWLGLVLLGLIVGGSVCFLAAGWVAAMVL